MTLRLTGIAALAAVVTSLAWAPTAWAQSSLTIEVLSSRPQLVSGGDALVRISGAEAAPTVTVGGADVSSAFAQTDAGWVGLVTGLVDGDNTLSVSAGGATAEATLVNHPTNGPLFSGPLQQPFVCENADNGLPEPTDENCSVEPQVAYSYRSTDGTWKAFEPDGPRPNDIDMTTTMDGKQVPLIVWREMGVINRSAYAISLLHDPAAGPLPTPISNETGWNGKLMLSFRGGVRPSYHMGRQIGTMDPMKGYVGGENNNLHESVIRNGYALAGGSLMTTGSNTNHIVQAETAAKIKERFIELFGPPQFTLSMGTSGGSMSQHLVAQDYPGIMDAINPWRSYPEVITFNTPLNDCNLLVNYFDNADIAWTQLQKTQVSGKLHFDYCVVPATRFPNLNPTNCDPAVLAYIEFSNGAFRPEDVRCTYQDNLVNAFGTDPNTGFARSPWDNTGIQYGLGALNAGVITVDQFIDLNAKIGGHDINGQIVPQRTVGDSEALRIVYETGRLNSGGGGLSEIPILDVRGYTDGICTVAPCPPREPNDVDVHDGYHTLLTRARLDATNGNHDNHVRIVTTEVGHRGPDSVVSVVSVEALRLLDEWVTAIKADTSDASPAQKLAMHKPAELVDACYTGIGSKITDMELCAKLFPIASDARMVAGAPPTNDVIKCQLKPVTMDDYTVPVSDEQLARISEAFPDGVCDYTKPGVGQTALAGTWAIYTGNGAVTYLEPAD